MPDNANSSELPRRRFGCLIVAVPIIAIVAFGLWLFGRVQGEEFSVATFRQREFTFYRVPWANWQVTPALREDPVGDLAMELQQQRLLTDSGVSPEWRVSWVQTGGRRRESDVAILTRYLDNQGQGPVWQEWTDDHPDLAARFWPVVQRAAAVEAYEVIPRLFDVARLTDDPADFLRQLDEFQSRLMTRESPGTGTDGDRRPPSR